MNLLENLKQFKNIHPDSGFSADSRRRVLGGRIRMQDILRTNVPMAFATLALGLLFVFAGTRFFTGGQVAGIDPRSLRAEAQAIDIQIQLTDLKYSSPDNGNETTPANVHGVKSSMSTDFSGGDEIDSALEALSE